MTQGGGSNAGDELRNDPTAGSERTEGRPSDVPPATPDDKGRPAATRDEPGDEPRTDRTVAPEEEGEEPATEHAPGSDL